MPKLPKIKKPSLKKPKLKKPTLKKPNKQSFKKTVKSVKLWTFTLLLAGIGMFGYASYIWYNEIFTDKDEIFYGMLDKSLNTNSVSRTVSQAQGTRSESQAYLLRFSPSPIIMSQSTVNEVGQTRQTSSVTTETIGDRENDFVRYTNISIPSTGEETNYEDVLNTWAKRTTSEEGSQAQFLNESIFSFIPFGNFDQGARAEMIQMIKDKEVYQRREDKVRYVNGRPIYEANLSIKPRALVEVLVKYNELTDIGDKSLLNPEEYEDYYSIGVQIKVDVLSRHLTEINYLGQGRSEAYTAYGSMQAVEIPEQTISVEELQAKLQ